MSLLIVIAEDEPGVRTMLQAHLEGFGYSVMAAKDGLEALEMIRQYQPHLLISDINMPKKNGYELVKEIRTIPQFRLLPVIFLTEFNQVGDRVQGYQVGCDAYLAKPFELEELEAVVRNLLARSQMIHTELIVVNTYQKNLASHVNQDTTTNNTKEEINLELTDKEKLVLELVIQGFSNINIGKSLHLSHRTIEKYVSRLLRKTETKNRADLIRFTLENKIL